MKKNIKIQQPLQTPKSSIITRFPKAPNILYFQPNPRFEIPTILKDAIDYLKTSGFEKGVVVNLNGITVPINSQMTPKEAMKIWKNEYSGRTNIYAKRKPQMQAKQAEIEPGE